jgi:hypothetical protein
MDAVFCSLGSAAASGFSPASSFISANWTNKIKWAGSIKNPARRDIKLVN